MNKKVLALVFSLSIGVFVMGQDKGDSKSFRFGLKASPSLNWYRTDNPKMTKGGKALGFGWGLITEFKLSESASLSTGLHLDYDKGEVKFTNDTSYYIGYYYSKDGKIVEGKTTKDTTMARYQLDSRKYFINYITLPAVIKMKTNEIGYLTYFGQFGFLLSFKTKARSVDGVKEIYPSPSSTPITLGTKEAPLDINKDSQLVRFQLSIGGGAEYNISGNTSLVFGLNYNRGFTNVLNPTFRSKSNYLVTKDGSPVPQKAFADNIALTVGILF